MFSFIRHKPYLDMVRHKFDVSFRKNLSFLNRKRPRNFKNATLPDVLSSFPQNIDHVCDGVLSFCDTQTITYKIKAVRDASLWAHWPWR